MFQSAGVTLDDIEKLFDLVQPGCNGVIQSSSLDLVPAEHYHAAFKYMREVQERTGFRDDDVKRSEEEGKGKRKSEGYSDADFHDEHAYFGGVVEAEFGGAGDEHYHAWEEMEPEGGGDYVLEEHDHHFRDELWLAAVFQVNLW